MTESHWASAVNSNLDQAAEVMNRHHGDTLPAPVAAALFAQAQAAATIALTQAVMHLADTIKEIRPP